MNQMKYLKYGCLVLFGAITSVSVMGQALPSDIPPTQGWSLPRTAWGDPDLQGIWRNRERLPTERHARYGNREFLTDQERAERFEAANAYRLKRLTGELTNLGYRNQLNYNSVFGYTDDLPRITRRTSAIIDPPNGRLPPWTPEFVKKWEEREAATAGHGETDTTVDMELDGRCVFHLRVAKVSNWGLGAGGGDPIGDGMGGENADGIGNREAGARRIMQSKGYVAITKEENGEYRLVPLGGPPRLGPKIRQWLGDSRGHWEGNTLVIETTNIKFEYPVIQNYSGMYPGSGETLRVTERYTRIDADVMEYRATIDDPGVYTRPYTMLRHFYRGDDFKVTTVVCQENTKEMANVLTNAQADPAKSLLIGQESVGLRKARFEERKKEAIEEANRQKLSR